MKKTARKILLILLAALVLVGGAFGVYAGDYYHADGEMLEAMSLAGSYERTELLEGGSLAYIPAEYDSAVIFYPGGKVEADAYIPLMERCARDGILAVLVPMPFNLAVLDVNAAADIPAQFPAVEHWYLAGHSLGGSMAASFASEQDWVEGVILLAAYSTADLSGKQVLSIYGTEDAVMNREKYGEYRENLPADCTEVILEGGNHAGFGAYGHQDGDGEANIFNQDQIEQTAQLIAEFVK